MIRRDVLPEIRQTGAYITNKANPEMLRVKANEIESLTILNETAKIMLPVFDEAGLKPEYKALALKQIYRKAGIDLPIEDLKAEREIFDLTSIAAEVGIYSNNDKPHGQALFHNLILPIMKKRLSTLRRMVIWVLPFNILGASLIR